MYWICIDADGQTPPPVDLDNIQWFTGFLAHLRKCRICPTVCWYPDFMLMYLCFVWRSLRHDLLDMCCVEVQLDNSGTPVSNASACFFTRFKTSPHGCFQKYGEKKTNHPLKNRVFHYFHHPFWGTPIFGKTHINSAPRNSSIYCGGRVWWTHSLRTSVSEKICHGMTKFYN